MAAFTSYHDGMFTDQATWRVNKVTVDFSGWALNGLTVLTNQISPPYNSSITTVSKYMETGTTSIHDTYKATSALTDNGRLRIVCWFKKGERDWAFIAFENKAQSGIQPFISYFDLTNGVVGSNVYYETLLDAVEVTSNITSVGDDWYRCECSYPIKTGANTTNVFVGPTTGNKVLFYAGDITKGIYIWSPTAWEDSLLNGGFDADSSWTKGIGATISGGELIYNHATPTSTYQSAVVIGRTYRITFTITSRTSGFVRVLCGSTGYGTWRSSPGTYTEDLICSGSTNLLINPDGTGAVLNVDNVILEDITNYPYLAADTATISVNNLVVYNTYNTVDMGSFTINGTFKASRTMSTYLNFVANAYCFVIGTMDWGKDTDPIPKEYLAELYFNTTVANQGGIQVNGTLYMNSDPEFYGSDFDTRLYSSWTSGRDLDIIGDFCEKWGYYPPSGSELLTNGSFDDATWAGSDPNKTVTGWNTGFTRDSSNYITNTVLGNACYIVKGTTSPVWIVNYFRFTPGLTYKYSFDIVSISAGCSVTSQGSNGLWYKSYTTIGTKVGYFTAISNDYFAITLNNNNTWAIIDNVSLKEVQPRELLGPERMTNGNFSAWSGDNPTGYTLAIAEDANNMLTEYPSAGGGKCRMVSNNNAFIITQVDTIPGGGGYLAGRIMKTTLTISNYVSGTLRVWGAALQYKDITANGTYTFYMPLDNNATANHLYMHRQAGNLDLVIDDISVKEVIVGRELHIHKYGTVSSVTADVSKFTIENMYYDGVKTTITVGEVAPAVTYNQNGLVLYTTRNVVSGRTYWPKNYNLSTLGPRIFSTTSASKLYLGCMLNGYYYLNGNQGTAKNSFLLTVHSSIRNQYSILNAGDEDVIRGLCFNANYLLNGCWNIVCENLYAWSMAAMVITNSRGIWIKDSCYIFSSASVQISSGIFSGKWFGNNAGIYFLTGAVFKDFYSYHNNYGPILNVNTRLESSCVIGKDEFGNVKRNTTDLFFGDNQNGNQYPYYRTESNSQVFEKCDLPTVFNIPASNASMRNYVGKNGEYRFVDYLASGDHRKICAFGEVQKDSDILRPYGATSTIKATNLQTNLTTVDNLPLVMAWSEENVPTTPQTRSIKVITNNNLVVNGNLEQWTDNGTPTSWSLYGVTSSVFTKELTEKTQGFHSAKLTIDASNNNRWMNTPTFSVVEGRTYRFRAKVKADVGAKYFCYVYSGSVGLLSDGVTWVSVATPTDAIAYTGTGSWQTIDITFVPYNNISAATYLISFGVHTYYTGSGNANKVYYFDDISVQDLSTPFIPTASELYFEATYLSSASDYTRTKIASTAICTSGDTYLSPDRLLGYGDMSTWTGVFPNEQPTSWASFGLRDETHYVSQSPTGQCRIYDGTGSGVGIYAAGGALTIGKTYYISFTITSRTLGALYVGDSVNRTYYYIPGTYTHTWVAKHTQLNFGSRNITDITFDNVTFREVLPDAQWTDLPVTFTPSRVGTVEYRAYLKKYQIGAQVYVDNMLYRGELESVPAIWKDGESQLMADYNYENPNKYSLRGNRKIYG